MNNNQVESGIQLFSRVNRINSLEGMNPNYFPEGGPFPNQIIEITGKQKLDKNDLLLDFIIKCILPNNCKSEWKSSGAILIICEHQINLFKIIKIIETHLNNNGIVDPKKEILENALKNLTIFNCYSLEDLELAIMNLERLIIVKENINLVAIDNITAYYWIAKSENNNLSYYQHVQQMFQKIFNVIKSLNVLFLYIRKQSNTASNKGFPNLDYRIDVEEDENQEGCFKSVITNFVKQSSITVCYKVNFVLEYL